MKAYVVHIYSGPPVNSSCQIQTQHEANVRLQQSELAGQQGNTVWKPKGGNSILKRLTLEHPHLICVTQLKPHIIQLLTLLHLSCERRCRVALWEV